MVIIINLIIYISTTNIHYVFSLDSDAGFNLNPSLPNNNSPYVNYDDLRRKNRIDYENKAIPRSS